MDVYRDHETQEITQCDEAIQIKPHLEIPHIEIVGVEDAWCGVMPPEGNVKQRNYRSLVGGVRAYTPTGDIHTSPEKRKIVPMYEPAAQLAPPREQLLALLRPGDVFLEAIIRPAVRCTSTTLPDDSWRYLQRTLLSPSPPLWAASPEPPSRATSPFRLQMDGGAAGARSLADELREAEQRGSLPAHAPIDAHECRDMMARLALHNDTASHSNDSEDRENRGTGSLRSAGARLDALLREARALQLELAAAQRDLQVLAARHNTRR